MDNFSWGKVGGCRISRHPLVRGIMYGAECGGMGWRGTESSAEGYFGDEKGQNIRNMQKYASTHFARCASLSCSLNVRSDLAMKIPSYLG